MTATCHIILCVIVRVIPRISSQNFIKKHTKPFSGNKDMYPPLPKKLKIAPNKGHYPP